MARTFERIPIFARMFEAESLDIWRFDVNHAAGFEQRRDVFHRFDDERQMFDDVTHSHKIEGGGRKWRVFDSTCKNVYVVEFLRRDCRRFVEIYARDLRKAIGGHRPDRAAIFVQVESVTQWATGKLSDLDHSTSWRRKARCAF